MLGVVGRHLRHFVRCPVHYQQLKQMMMFSTGQDSEVLFEKVGSVGVITLNRPKALNAFNLNMARRILPQLKSWENDVSFVVIKGAGDKAFCAGGDIRAVTEAGRKGDPSASEFFEQEYRTNYKIGTLKVPYVALIHGITMGGGVGLSVHGKYRVATERTVFAMPETAIGLFPDVGASFFLPKLKGELGTYLGLTGYRLKGIDVFKAGVATHYCTFEQLKNLEKELLDLKDATKIDSLLEHYQKMALSSSNPDFVLQPHIKKIDKNFSGNTVQDILSNLMVDGSDWAAEQLEILNKMSPSSMKITLKLLRDCLNLPFKECLQMELRVVIRILAEKDFYEGVRALLIDRDNNPKWSPSSLEDVTREKLNSFFEPLPKDLDL